MAAASAELATELASELASESASEPESAAERAARRGLRLDGESSICGVSEGSTPSAAAACTSGALAYGSARSASLSSSDASSSAAKRRSTPPPGLNRFCVALEGRPTEALLVAMWMLVKLRRYSVRAAAPLWLAGRLRLSGLRREW